MRVLLIDDMRTEENLRDMGKVIMPTKIVRTYEDAILAISGEWDLVYLDHDLGHDEMHKTGYGVIAFLEELHNKFGDSVLPGQIELVTSNPVGRQRMQMVIDRLYK